MKKLTLTKLRTLALSKCAKSDCYNELDLIIVPDKEEPKSYEKIKFIYTGNATLYKKKKSKKNPRTMKDYNKGKFVYRWLNDKKNKQNDAELVYINGLLNYENSDYWHDSSLQLCKNNKIAYNCIDDEIYYKL
jgi:hypothetical protein